MSLEELAAERPRAHLRLSIYVLVAWILWLSMICTIQLPSRLSLPCTAAVLIFGTFYWPVFEGLFILLLMGFLYRGFSLTPPGFYFVALAIIFLLMKFIMFRLSVRTIPQLLTAIFLGSIALDLIQWNLLRMVAEVPVGSWSTLGGILISGLLQVIVSLIFVRPLLSLVAHK